MCTEGGPAFAVGPTLAAVRSRPELVGKRQLYNHLPLKLKDDDFLRTQLIPKKKVRVRVKGLGFGV